ncbi:MAG: LamG domain-containing protein [Polyangiaceae bacterium]
MHQVDSLYLLGCDSHTFVQTANDVPERWGTIVSTERGMLGGWEVMIERNQTTPAVNFAFWKGPDKGDFTGWTIANVPLDEWTHVGAVVDKNAQSFEFYVNGVVRGRATTTLGILPGSETLTMGQYPAGGRDLDGDVDEIAIWNRALATAEMAFLYEHPLPPLQP